MQQVRDEEEKQGIHPTDTGQVSAEDDYEFSDDIEVIFRREYSKLDTIPLRQEQPLCWPLVRLVLVMFVSLVAGAVIGIVTYPTVTITIIPFSKHVTITTPLSIPIRQLAPVTLMKSESISTTGHGHQDAKTAYGRLTFYNGRLSAQYVPGGTVFTGNDGVKIVTDEPAVIPAGNPPAYGERTLLAHAMWPGAAGNIQAGDINLVLSSDLLVKNLAAFSGGQDERNFQTVAQADLDTLTVSLQKTLSQHIPQAFPLPSTYSLHLTHCRFSSQPDHQVGEEAQTVTVKAVDTCSAVAYDTQELQQKIEATFTSTQPGKHYQTLGQVSSKVLTVTPFKVQVSGTWVYLLPEDYEQFLAEKIAGETPQQARKYLLSTGLIVDAHIPAQLPRDPQHIHFETIIGAAA